MSTQYSLSHIIETTKATLISNCSAERLEQTLIEQLLYDSRLITSSRKTLFFAIKTERGDGHNYILELYHLGVRAFVITEMREEWRALPEVSFLLVPDVLRAMQAIAIEQRSKLSCPVIGITGSNGKTTLKEFLYFLLHKDYRVGRSPRSYNSAIGVPLSLWNLSSDLDWAILEAGISKPGEMAALEPMIQPTIGVLTNIGDAHQENFSSLLEKATQKLLLFKNTPLLITSQDDPLLQEAITNMGYSGKTIGWSYQDKTATLWVEKVEYLQKQTLLTFVYKGKRMCLTLPFQDEGSLQDLYLALLVLGEIAPEILSKKELFEELQPVMMRLEIVEGENDILLINDTYNADYDALKIALPYLHRRNETQKPTAVILSEFQESSYTSSELSDKISALLLEQPPTQVITIGSNAPRINPTLQHLFFPEVAAFLEWSPQTKLAGYMILLKGARQAHFEQITSALQKKVHQTILDVNLTSLVHNLNSFRDHLGADKKMICMIKAFGYGVGSYKIAQTLQTHHADYLAVATTDEGKELREHGIRTPIIVMNPEPSSFRQLIYHQLEPNIYSTSLLHRFIQTANDLGEKEYPIHLKWDTGMHRLGMIPQDIPLLLAMLNDASSVKVSSIFTHLAAADDPREDEYTLGQLDALDQIEKSLTLPYSYYKHALNSAAAIRFPDYPSDMIRLGIGLYGLSPLEQETLGLLPVASLHTVLLQVRELPAGATIGYGRKQRLERPSRIGVIPIGYADGIPRALGNGAITFKTEEGVLVPTCGHICMDTIMLDLTDAPSATEGTRITLFDETLPISRLSDACQTIHYEILSRLSQRINRNYFTE